MNNFETVIKHEQERLARIGSDKDPVLFQAMRSAHPGELTMNRSLIVNMADETTSFGCRFKCTFCSWRDRATAAGDIFPTREGVTRFLEGFAGYKVTISGGGDPLFKLEQNWPRLRQLVDWVHELGFLVEVVTKETALVANLLNPSGAFLAARRDMCDAVQAIDAFSLSYEAHSQHIVEEVRAIASHRPVRVSKVCTPGFSRKNREVNGREWDFLGQYCAAMRGAGAYQVLLREDFYDPHVSADDVASIARAVARGRGTVRWLPNSTCSNNYFLIGEEVYQGDAALGGVRK